MWLRTAPRFINGTPGTRRVHQGHSFIIFLVAISINFCVSTHFVLLWYFMCSIINIGSFFLVGIGAGD